MAGMRVCQMQNLPQLSEGQAEIGPLTWSKRIKLWMKRHLSASTKRQIKRAFVRLLHREPDMLNYPGEAISLSSNPTGLLLQPNDRVRVRSQAEIRATLDLWGELKNCRYMDSMWQYCGTQQRVLKPVERFVDERDYRMKKTSGMVLLENLMCQGTPDYGRCDRSCYYFWRVEWLEKVD